MEIFAQISQPSRIRIALSHAIRETIVIDVFQQESVC